MSVYEHSFMYNKVMDKVFIVCTPYADLRKEPVGAHGGYIHDDLQETQLLYNEVVIFRHEHEGWCYVEALEQKTLSRDKTWHGYPGWVEKKNIMPVDAPPLYDLVVKKVTAMVFRSLEKTVPPFVVSAGTRFKGKDIVSQGYLCVELADGTEGWIQDEDVYTIPRHVSKETIRESIAKTAMLFLDLPYLWGGRSTFSGVDCSGLTNLVYRVNGIDIPRNAGDQKWGAKEIPYTLLKKADFIFASAEGSFDTITHVMLYLEGDSFIESSETGSRVNVTTFKEKFGFTLEQLSRKDFVTEKKKISFGTVVA